MVAIEKRRWTMFPDLYDFMETLPRPFVRVFGEEQPVRVEDYEQDGRYVLRAEIPDIDPHKDLEITVADGMLTVHGERREESKDKYHSEFRYGSFTRSVQLPKSANADDVVAKYVNGILTVSVGMQEVKEESKRIPISS